jgi:type II secretory pathway pseudopilin PulG
MRHAARLLAPLAAIAAIAACSAQTPLASSEDGSTAQGTGANGGSGQGTSTGTGTGTGTGTSTGTGTGTGTSTGTNTGQGGAGGGPACAPMTGDCNADPKDGCEANLATDTKNCGACGTACPSGGGAAATCASGVCGLACAKGQGDCDKNAANGCEADLFADAKNCGACGIDCGGQPCVQGACACAAETQKAELVQLDLFVMLDHSASMQDTVQGGGSKWDAMTTALKGFLGDPANASLGVGLQYFGVAPSQPPPLSCKTNADCGAYGPCFAKVCLGAVGGGSGDSCDPNDYAKAAIEIALLNAAQVSALDKSIAAAKPDGASTPTAPAIQGAVKHAQAWETAHPGHAVVVILATDGDPTGCDPQDPQGAAAAGLAGAPSVKTFVIGVGASLGSLNGIAAAGGTQQAFLVDTNQNVIQQFQAALKQIQKAAIGCEYAIPQPKQGQLDLTKVNVTYTPGNGQPETLGNVANKGACDPQKGGWYYDDPNKPLKIELCPSTCTAVQADAKAEVDVQLGCATLHQ